MIRLAMLVSGLALLAACSASSAPAPRDTPKPVSAPPPAPVPDGDAQATLPLGKITLEAAPRAPVMLTVEVARTPRQQQMGLMFRRSLADDAGMFFIFPIQRHLAFWMHNTLIPLDMFFIDSAMNVVGVVEDATPLTDDAREVAGDSQYVLEVNAGFAKKHGFGPGTKVTFVAPEEN